MILRHSRQHNNRHNPTTQYKQQPRILQMRNQSIRKNNKRRDKPCDEDICDIRVPWLDLQVGVEHGVELNADVCHDLRDGSKVEDPAEEIDGAGEEAEDAAVFEAGGYGGPVVDAAG